ncbi:MAG TPA: 3-hydroxyacyl-CoA dehydrogenase NAD-binding domain-containing protein [Acidobacteriaceae bacterium]|nr:3-hydroxyacyl-CoA dehydrogenase NAD-binding domain-containing protein [Acidobacteriaceae bacterium]
MTSTASASATEHLSASAESAVRSRRGMIQRAGVLGAGTMGVRIAAHLANAGIPVVLLDLAGDGGKPIAASALEILGRAKPAAFYDPASIRLVQPGTFDRDLDRLSQCDWVIEAVTENLAIKRDILAKISSHLKPGVILTTNTSGLPVATIAEQLPSVLRRSWFGTHFFNPPRYMRLLEIVPTPETDPAAIAAIADFADRRLGKTIVYAHDTPNFIANRIGVYIMTQAMELMQEQGLSIEEVDALTGSAIGWPRTGIFRLADMVGIDILAHVVANFAHSRAGEELVLPHFIQAMLDRRWLGDKTGQGFYKKEKDAKGEELRLALDWQTLDYHPAARPKFPALEMAKNAESLPERLRLLLAGDVRKDKAAAFHRKLLDRLFAYAANCLPEIAAEPASIDRAMRAGFNWELGPFEMWDAVGVDGSLAPNAKKLLDSGASTWYRDKLVFDPIRAEYVPVIEPAGIATVADFRDSHGIVKRNSGASLIDLGEGIAAIELHSNKDAVGEDITRLVTQVLNPGSDAVRDFQGFVITGDRANFSVGANLFQVLLFIQEGEWEDLDFAVRAFQRMTAAIKFCPRPVVVAPFGLCLGGGAEIALHAARRQAHAELYMGLVETGVGVVPAGGGTKEMALRSVDAASGIPASRVAGSTEYFDALKRNFELIGMAKVSTSAADARLLGYLSTPDGVTVHRDRLLEDAKQVSLALASAGYAAPVPREIPAAGESVLATLKLGVHLMRQAEYISDHDQKVANHVANILCGGAIPPGTMVGEQYLLDLERQAFLSLCGERKTQERIAFTLKTGKPLRN